MTSLFPRRGRGPRGSALTRQGRAFHRYLQRLYRLRGRSAPEPFATADFNALILDTIARSDLLGIATRNLTETDHGDGIAMLPLAGQVERETAILAPVDDVLPRTAHDLIDALADVLGDGA